MISPEHGVADMKTVLLLTLLLLSFVEAAPSHGRRWRSTISARPTIICAVAKTAGAGVAFALDQKRITTSTRLANSNIVAADTAGYSNDDHNRVARPRQLVVFRAPSRHTYGFVQDSKYDLPIIELRNLIGSTTTRDDNDIHFIPVESSLQQPENMQQRPTSKQQSKKKGAKKHSHRVQLLYWIECPNEISPSDIAKAASRAILTHATFSISEIVSVSEEDWQEALNDSSADTHSSSRESLEQTDVIDMTNPNMSRNDRSELIERVVSCLQLDNHFGMQYQSDDERNLQPILMHHCTAPVHPSGQPEQVHHFYFGHRTSIGPAGTQGAPSQTLRRTHRGLLKEYALKNRRIGISDTTSTAMEPEIGFLMANLALVGVNASMRVLDPCCGSGGMLLYAAALGAEKIVGVDSDGKVWKDAECEFQSHACVSDGKSPLAVPEFFHGDVQTPSLTEVLCNPNSVDSIVCDPPYNIGAPILVSGEDNRPRNYHAKNDTNGRSGPIKGLAAVPDLVPHIMAIASKVLVGGGRLVFFLPVRGEELRMPVEELLSLRDNSSDSLRLVESSTRLQKFSPTFSRWLVCMEKRIQI